VDRSAAYAARQAALHVVRSGLASSCEIALSYAIGVEQPVAIHIQADGSSEIELTAIQQELQSFDFSPAGIIDRLDLRTPIFERTAREGHVGVKGLPWERARGSKRVCS
jgi:S-adenosylmethionine synthetase